jgi:two-component system response regulator YesN
LRWPYEAYITGEDQTVILIHDVRAVEDAALEKAAAQLVERMRRLSRRELFITVGAAVSDPERLAPEVETLQECGGYKFFVDAGTVIFDKDGFLSGPNAAHVAEGLTRSLFEDIHYGDFGKAVQRLELLFKTMEHSNVSSALYVKNLSAEVLRKAAQRARLPLSGTEWEEIMRAVMDSRSLYSLMDYVTLRLRAMGKRTGDETRKTAAHRAVDDAISIIREEYANPSLNMEYIARRVYLSPSYFSGVFKSETGESATHFLARYRLERARELLERTGNKISDISAKVGFSSSSYFVTVFHGAYGLSPAQYREQQR